MREILFRAKTKMIVGTYNCGKEDGEWVTGYLHCDVGKWMIFQFEFDVADYVGYEVDPETVCQYVDFNDKGGKKIFENDICEIAYDGEVYTYVVVWDKQELDFKVTNGKENYGNEFKYLSCCDEVVIIGNIFDTPEIMRLM